MMFNSVAFRIALSSLLRQKKTLFALLISLLPIAAAGLVMLEDRDHAAFFGDEWDMVFSEMAGLMLITGTIPLTALLLAGGMIADEAEERTLSYLLVRPVPRIHLYLSRAIAVLAVALPLAFLQVLGLWVMRWISYGQYAPEGARIFVTGDDATVSAVGLMWAMFPVVLVSCLVGMAFYCILFGLTSVVSTRYHFFINLGYLGLWEAMMGHVPFGGQRLTVTHHLVSFIEWADPTVNLILGIEETNPAISIPLLIVLGSSLMLVAMVVVRQRDFHVTSAAT